MMTSLLAGLGLKHFLPVRQTPKLIFFILGNSTNKKKKHATESTEESGTTQVQEVEPAPSAGQTTTSSKAVTNVNTPESMFNWKLHVRAQLASTLKAGTLKHFTQDFSEVSPNEFAIQLSDDLVVID